MNILETLAKYASDRVTAAKKAVSADEMMKKAYMMKMGDLEFEKALKKDDISFICECKKASPSKGIISEDFPYLEIAVEYEKAGADCISVLTEPMCFLGKKEYLKEIAGTVSIPCLRKDFVVDEYMIYEAKILGAAAVLLIVSILSEDQLKRYLKICDDLGMSALVEVHDEVEIKTALKTGARIIGVNNRNLKTFSVNQNNSINLRKLVPDDIVFVSESGVKTRDDIIKLRENKVNAVLIGEALMREKNRKAKLSELRKI